MTSDVVVPGSPTASPQIATVIVPLANPANARDLLTLGAAATGGGQVVGLVVVVDGDEEAIEAALHGSLEDVVTAVDAQRPDVEVRLHAHSATSVARGILDQVRETRADLVVLGLQTPRHGRMSLGTITESVLQVATCDVLIYRPPTLGGLDDVRGIGVAAEAGDGARPTTRLGLRLGDGLGLPVELVHVLRAGVPRSVGHHRLDQLLQDTGAEHTRRTILHGDNPAEVVLAHTSDRDLVVTGLPPREQRHVRGLDGVCLELFEGARGPVVGITRKREATGIEGRLQRWLTWLRPELTRAEQETVVWQARRDAAPSLDFHVLMMVSSVLASLGLLLDSSAVIIGAMLVAPLMGPLVASAAGISTGLPGIASRSWSTVLGGAAAAAAVAALTALVTGTEAASTEMLARGAPSLLDAGVALASGVAGAYATARKDIPAALAGVAIAAALVPPLCVAAMGAVLGDGSLALGAALLFGTNIVCIAGMASVVFWWLGLGPRTASDDSRRWVPALGIAVATALVAVLAFDPGADVIDRAAVVDALAGALPEVEVVDVEMAGVDPRRATVTLRSTREPDPPALEAARDALAVQFGAGVEVRFVHQQLLLPTSDDPSTE